MSFFSSIRAKAEAIGQRFGQIRKSIDKSLSREPSPAKSINFSFDVRTSKAGEDIVTHMAIYFDQNVRRELLQLIGQRGLEEIRESLRPITRTGGTADSFSYKIVGNDQLVISSNEPQAASIITGIRGKPPTDALLSWMKNKPEFSGMEEKEQQGIAFAIQRSIAGNKTPGRASTISKLAPVGTRKYNYLEIVERQLSKEIEQALRSV
jgi:hypothetical protein